MARIVSNKVTWLSVAIFWFMSFQPSLAETEIEENEAISDDNASVQEHVPVIERTAYLDPEQKQQLALAKTLKEYEVNWLQVRYPDIEEPRSVLSIIHQALIPQKQGAVLILHDKEQHADWPRVVRPLRKNLPKAGWFTLSLSLPDETRINLPERELAAKTLDQIQISEAVQVAINAGSRGAKSVADSPIEEEVSSSSEAPSENTEMAEETEEDSVDINLSAAENKPNLNRISYVTRALKHVEEAYQYLKQQSYENIILLSYGHSAELILYFIESHQGDIQTPGFAAVMVEPVISDVILNDLSKWLGKGFRAPVLDVINRNSYRANETAELRKFSMQRVEVENYQQMFISINNTELFDEGLSKRIKTWLSEKAPGMKIGPDN